jgi:hypothetical protein
MMLKWPSCILILRNRLGGCPDLKLTTLYSLEETQFHSTAPQHTIALTDTLITWQVMRLEHNYTRVKCRGPFRIIVPTFKNCALLGCYAASSGNSLENVTCRSHLQGRPSKTRPTVCLKTLANTTTLWVTPQKSAALVYFWMEAWNHA